jgi:hypothetical protein
MAGTLCLRGRWFEAGLLVGCLLRDFDPIYQGRAGMELDFVTGANF